MVCRCVRQVLWSVTWCSTDSVPFGVCQVLWSLTWCSTDSVPFGVCLVLWSVMWCQPIVHQSVYVRCYELSRDLKLMVYHSVYVRCYDRSRDVQLIVYHSVYVRCYDLSRDVTWYWCLINTGRGGHWADKDAVMEFHTWWLLSAVNLYW